MENAIAMEKINTKMKKGAFSYFSYLKGLTLQFSVFQHC